MSEKVFFLKIAPPDNMDKPKAGEAHKFPPCPCPRCAGAGGFDNGGWAAKFKANYDDPDLEVCPVCRGTGQLEASVVIGWAPCGAIKKPFNSND
jgi:hypothetical protein